MAVPTDDPGDHPGDHRGDGSRRDGGGAGTGGFLQRHVEGVVYLAAGISYVLASLAFRPLLNWIVGPAWLIVWVWLVPPLLERRPHHGGPR